MAAATSPLGTDYRADAGPAVAALAHGDFAGYVGARSQMGPLTLLARAPIASVAPSTLWQYRLGALLCLLALVAFVVMLAPRAGAIGAAVLGGALLVGGPTFEAWRLGHPEMFAEAAFAVGAVLLAPRRPGLAGLALGAALATKQTGLIAVAPALLAAPAGTRRRLAAIAGGVATALILPGAIAAPHAFVAAMRHPAFGLAALRTGNPWLAVADIHHIKAVSVDAYVVPGWLRSVAHPAIALLTVGGGLLVLARRRTRVEPLALLALLWLVRCALDPWNHGYYHLPFLAALAAWEIVRRGRAPWLAAASSAWLAVAFRLPLQSADIAYLAWAVPAGLWLASVLSAPATRTASADRRPAAGTARASR
jgi:hypothetical protein